MKRVLLVEDDKSLGTTLKERLQKESLDVVWVRDAESALSAIEKHKFSLAILDVGLPDGDGFSLAIQLRDRVNTPFIFVTAQGEAHDRLKGYEIGAEEYIPKPFHLKEFLMRVTHVLENHAQEVTLVIEDVKIDLEARMVTRSGIQERLSLKEFQVLKLLIDLSPRVVSRDEILNRVWGSDEFPTNRTVDNIILRLRQVLGERASRVICSVRGVGYQWLLEDNNTANLRREI